MRQTRLRLLPLCLAIAGVVRAQEPPKPSWILCGNPYSLPLFTELAANPGDREATPTDITAEKLNVQNKDVTVFSGNTQLRRADQYLSSDQITYTHNTEQFLTGGPVKYQDRNIHLTASQAAGNQKTNTLQLDNVTYQFNDEPGNGQAKHAVVQGERGTLTTATYSTCPPNQQQWKFSASKISINQATATGVAHNAVLHFGRIPVLWLPIMSFPTDDRRRSGVLSPTIGRDDRNGLDIKLPVYLNLAPNYDATLTPRWLSKRGLMLGGEFRYLGTHSQGNFTGTWLPDDALADQDRSYLTFAHNTRFNVHWYANASLQHISDVNYFSDFGDSIYNTSISMLPSTTGIFGSGKFWNANLTADHWQIASPLVQPGGEPYNRLPRLQASAFKPLARWLDAGIAFEAVNFSHDTRDGGRRIDIEPYIRFPLGGNAWFVTPQLAWRYTDYSLAEGLVAVDADQTPRRSLPILSLDTGAYFERNLHWGKDYIQTLEPRLYYLRVPYRDQSQLPVFDTQELTFGWTSLFRDNRFGGADRQADANQMSLALTSRFLNTANGHELLSIGLGRITYFDTSQVTLPGGQPPSDDGSDWVMQADYSLNDRWKIGVAQQWDPDHKVTQLSSVRSQVRLRNGGVFNADYRYRRDQLEQTDLSLVLPLNLKWNFYGRWNYSLRENQTLDALGGLEWKSCCVAVRVLGRQYIRSFNSRQNLGLYIEIQLNGLGSFGRDTDKLLNDAILGYTR